MKITKILVLVLSIVMLGVAGSQAFSLYDGSGRKLGTFVYENTVYVPSWKKIVYFDTNPDSPYFGNIGRYEIFFTGTGCTGDAYIQFQWVTEYVFQNGEDLWTGSKTDSPTLAITIMSQSDRAGVCSDSTTNWSYGWRLEPYVPKKIPFKLPLTFPLRLTP